MRLKLLRKSSVGVAFLICLFAVLTFGQGIEAQEDPAGKKQASSDAQKAAVPEKGASAAAEEELQKAVQNPVARLIGVPLQNNSNFSLGSFNRTQAVLNIKPVIPANLSKNWMLITRVIQPIIWQPYPTATTGREYGLGDMVPTFFLSARKPGKLIWGAGPELAIPTATNTILGQGKLSLGPSGVVLAQPGPWTLGLLVNNVWSIAGSGSRPAVNQMLMQRFITCQLGRGGTFPHHPFSPPIGESLKRQGVDRAVWRRHRKSNEIRFSARQLHRSVLRERRVSIGRFELEHAFADCFPAREAEQGTVEANTGEKAEAT